MNRTCKVALLLAAGAVGISLAASAQKQQPGAIAPPPRAELGPQRRRISLREALQLAAEQSPDVAPAREAEKVALRREQDARARIAAGTDVEIALLRAQTETSRARAQIANIQGQKDSTLPVLEALVGEPIDPLPARIEDFGPSGEEAA